MALCVEAEASPQWARGSTFASVRKKATLGTVFLVVLTKETLEQTSVYLFMSA